MKVDINMSTQQLTALAKENVAELHKKIRSLEGKLERRDKKIKVLESDFKKLWEELEELRGDARVQRLSKIVGEFQSKLAQEGFLEYRYIYEDELY